jgi:hypothetical protein
MIQSPSRLWRDWIKKTSLSDLCGSAVNLILTVARLFTLFDANCRKFSQMRSWNFRIYDTLIT